jgi:sec-independent protein translocase protein TatC
MSSNNFSEEMESSLISHLVELRDRVLKMVLSVVVLALALLPFANEIYSFLAEPLLKVLPQNSTMIAIEVMSPLLTPIKLTFMAAIFIDVPVILYQLWAFIAPGLYHNEKRLILPLLVASTLLFYTGVAFAYFVIFPLMFGLLTATAPAGVAMMTDINKYLETVVMLFTVFGVCFEVPIFTIVLVRSGVISRESLAEKRPYVIVGAFVIGMILTPPDPISQTLLAVPMWLLFEVGLLCTRFFARPSTENSLVEIEHESDL